MTHYVENAHVPQKDSSDDQRMRDVVGTKIDRANSNSLYGRNYRQEQHIHSEQKVYPTLADSVTLTDHANPWTLGALVEIVPANSRVRARLASAGAVADTLDVSLQYHEYT